MPETNKALVWDLPEEKNYETGVDHGVLYLYNDSADDQKNAYDKGVVWNGLSAVSESPSGGEPTPIWADNTKYLNLLSAEEFAATITAYTYPDEFEECDGSAALSAGVSIGQQSRKTFALCYRTKIGDETNPDKGYKIHIIYGCKASPSERAYNTVNDSPDALSFSWEVSTTPVPVTGFKPTACLVIDSTDPTINPTGNGEAETPLAKLEKILYGSTSAAARLPLPDEIKTILTTSAG